MKYKIIPIVLLTITFFRLQAMNNDKVHQLRKDATQLRQAAEIFEEVVENDPRFIPKVPGGALQNKIERQKHMRHQPHSALDQPMQFHQTEERQTQPGLSPKIYNRLQANK